MNAVTPRVVKLERGYPLVGHAVDALRDGPQFLLSLARKHPGEVIGFRLGPVTCYFATSPEQIQQILQDDWRSFGKGGGMWKAARPLFGNGLLSSDGDVWRRQRRLMQPLFSASHLASLVEVMRKVVEQEVESLASRKSNAEVDMVTEMSVFTQRVLLETLFGEDSDRGDAEHLIEQIQIAFREINLRVFLSFLPEGFPLPGDRVYRRAVAELDDAMFRLVRARRAMATQRNDLLSRLLGAQDEADGGGMDDRQLRDELVTIFVAGNETTALAMSWLWYLLDRHPEVDRRLRAEVADVLGGSSPTYASLSRLTYTKRVVQETLRLYPPGWLSTRFVDNAISLGGYHVPAGSMLVFSSFVTQRDPAFWPDPEAFDPDRFTPERAAGRPHYAYYPFGGGPRKCIGEHFAIMESQIIISMMVQRFRPTLAPGARVVPASSSTLKPRYGLKMRLTPVPDRGAGVRAPEGAVS